MVASGHCNVYCRRVSINLPLHLQSTCLEMITRQDVLHFYIINDFFGNDRAPFKSYLLMLWLAHRLFLHLLNSGMFPGVLTCSSQLADVVDAGLKFILTFRFEDVIHML